MNPDLSIAILAGGASRRMGRDKTTLDWHGRPLLVRAVEIARAAGAASVAIAGSSAIISCTPLHDAVRDRGPLGGIIAALRWQPRVLVLACDMPLVSPEFLIWLWQRARDFPGWTVPGAQPLCSVYTAALLPWLEAAAARPPAPGARSLTAILNGAPRQCVAPEEMSAHGFDPRMFANLNTPAEYAEALIPAGPGAALPHASRDGGANA